MIRIAITTLLMLLAGAAHGADFQITFPDAGVYIMRDLDQNVGNSTMASGERLAVITRSPRAGAVSWVAIRTATVTTGQTLRVSLQNVNTSTGYADGTEDQTATVALINTDDNVWKTATFGSTRTVDEGELFAVVVDWDSTAGNMQLLATAATMGEASYLTRYASSTWSRLTRGAVIVIGYSDGVIANGYGLLGGAPTNTNYGNNSSPDEIGLKFQLPAGGRALGAWFRGRIAAAEFVLYDAAGSVLTSGTIAPGAFQTASGVTGAFYVPFEATKPQLSADTDYRLTLRPSSTDQVRLYSIDFSTSAWRAAYPDGLRLQYTHRVDAGSWTDLNASIPAISLVLDQIETGGGGGTGARRNRIQGHGF